MQRWSKRQKLLFESQDLSTVAVKNILRYNLNNMFYHFFIIAPLLKSFIFKKILSSFLQSWPVKSWYVSDLE